MKNKLYILPFDHRSTFQKGLFGWEGQINANRKKIMTQYKTIIYKAFLQVANKRNDKENFGILVGDTYGKAILQDAKKKKYTTIQTVEKSGQKIFSFNHGKDFGRRLLQIKPDYAKVLVRYNPVNKKDNQVQLKRLKKMNDFCQQYEMKWLFELLVPATEKQAEDKNYDKKLRPSLTAKAIREIRAFGIEPDIWKLEAMPNRKDWQPILRSIKVKNKKDWSIVVLGRAAPKKVVEDWFKKANKIKEINGFAVGRTIFFKPLQDYLAKRINQKQTIDRIAKNFSHFVNYWERINKC